MSGDTYKDKLDHQLGAAWRDLLARTGDFMFAKDTTSFISTRLPRSPILLAVLLRRKS